MKRLACVVLIFLFKAASAQKPEQVITSDIDNFWVAYDSIRQTDDAEKKLVYINSLYIDKASAGLKSFMKLRDYDDALYVDLIEKYPRFWNSIRANTLSIKNKTHELVGAVEKFQELYPELENAQMVFTIGGLRSGGTVAENMVLIGAEIATATPDTDVSEFKSNWLKNVFASQSLDNIVFLNVHEYVHTQQKPNNSGVLLHQVIREGACDFIAELVLSEPWKSSYMIHGQKHLKELKQQFKGEMFSGSYSNWLYNGGSKVAVADLGYFIGYEICKAYYAQAKDTLEAIKEIIELDYNDEELITTFLKESAFYKNGFDKEKLIEAYSQKQPSLMRTEPFENGEKDVDPSLSEFRIVFSKEMNPSNYSFNYGEKGKEAYPIKKVIGFENNNQTVMLGIDLEPDKEYEFIINCEGFSSKDGFPAKGGEYLIRFKTDGGAPNK